MPKLLIATTVPATIRAFLEPWIDRFGRYGWTVDTLCGDGGYQRAQRLPSGRDFVVNWSRSPLDPRNFRRAVPQVRRILVEQQPDILHVHTPVAGFCSRLAARGLRAGGLQVVYTAHGFHFHPQGNAVSNGIYRTLERIAGRWTDELVVINRHDEREAIAYRIVPADRITFTPGIGIDTREWSAERVDAGAVQAVASELRIPAGTPLALMVAEFNPGKRHADALRAFAAMRARNAHLLFAGTGPQQESMQELSASLGVGERVHFLGMRRDIPALMAAAAFLVLPSEREGLPRSILEAMALGRCVIGTDIRGIRDLLEPDRGVLVPLGDWRALAAAMDGVLADPVHAERLGRNARAAAVDCYDTRRILEQHAVLYDRCLRRRGSGTMRRFAAL